MSSILLSLDPGILHYLVLEDYLMQLMVFLSWLFTCSITLTNSITFGKFRTRVRLANLHGVELFTMLC